MKIFPFPRHWYLKQLRTQWHCPLITLSDLFSIASVVSTYAILPQICFKFSFDQRDNVSHTSPNSEHTNMIFNFEKEATLFCRVEVWTKWTMHDDVIKWKHFPRYWPFVREIHRSPVNSPHKGQWHGALMISLICAWINAWVNNREAGDLRRYRANCDVTVMDLCCNKNFQIRFCDRKFYHIDGNITEDYYRLPNNLILVMAYSFLHSTQWIFYKI